MTLTNKHILLGITGGIAAYKAAELIRALKMAGADVRVVLTQAAQAFIAPLTLQALSGHRVHSHLLDPDAEATMSHIELARWADFIIIAPASAHFMAQLATGQASDLLTTLCLATRAPVAIAPAMNQAMWLNHATQANRQMLIDRDVMVWGPDDGEQACGEVGPGRLSAPDKLVALIANQFDTGLLDGMNVVVTAGPTREAIDPARYISNRSSGKMGFAMATAAMEAGASVTLISGPVALATPPRMQRIDVTNTQQMFDAVMASLPGSDLLIGAAAVADYRPDTVATHKINKNHETLQLTLVRNRDIISAAAQHKPRPFIVGFAAQTEQVCERARCKLEAKQLDMIVANDVSGMDTGFDSDENEATLLWREGEKTFPRCSKAQLARELIETIARHVDQVK